MILLDEKDITGYILCHDIPEKPGVYIVTDKLGYVFYVGSSNCLRRRIGYLETHVFDSSSGRFIHDASDPVIKLQADGIDIFVHYIECKDYKKREKQLKQKYCPPWNKD